MVIKFIILIVSLLTSISFNQNYTYVDKEIDVFNEIKEVKKEKVKEEKKETKKVVKQQVKKSANVKETKKVDTSKVSSKSTYKGNITAYGPDCKGCSGITASGYKVKNTIYYNDKTYGKVRIVAADKSLPFGTIVRISDLSIFNEPIIAIVLDRGSAIGFNKSVYFDLLYQSEKASNSFGKRKATFEILRRGY